MDNIYPGKSSPRIWSNIFPHIVMCTFWKCYPAVHLMRLHWGKKKEKDAGVGNVSSKSLNA